MNLDYFYTIVILMGVGFLYRRFVDKYDNDELSEYNMIKNYLLSESSIAKSKKPILWIHVPYEINSRTWESFFSRNSMKLNKPYIYLTIESIIQCCKNSFKICLIDDKSFINLIPGWNIDLDKVGSPVKQKIRHLALAKLIYNYGGITVPNSFICLNNLINVYENNKPFVFENIAKNTTEIDFIPDSTFYGAEKNCPLIHEYCSFLEILISKDYTDESNFLTESNKWFYNECFNKHTCNVINGKTIGVKDKNNNPILIDNLFEEKFDKFDNNMYGLYIDDSELMKRTNYNWFCYLHENQILLECNNTLSNIFNKAKKIII